MIEYLNRDTVQTRFKPGSYRAIRLGDTLARCNANGQQQNIGQREYVWDALGKLTEIWQEATPIARYTYNHRGERIGKTAARQTTHYLYENQQLSAEFNDQGQLTRQYLYLADQPMAVIDTPEGQPLSNPEQSPLDLIAQDAKTILKIWFQQTTQPVWLHTNHLGAPEAATDASANLVWQARYAAFGQADITSQAAFTLHLRLPGQYEDPETGLYYNRQRYYDPQRGQYLSADPLGTPDGPNGYAYVRYNPLKYVDPDGLVLFAFDGTGNSKNSKDPAMAGNGSTNVLKFMNLYNESMNGKARYVAGVGTIHEDVPYGDIVPATYADGTLLDWLTYDTPLFYNDLGGNYSGPARIDRMMLYMRDEADAFDNDKVMDIDIIGFSRGASQARDFANRIVAKSVVNNGKTYYSYTNKQGEAACQEVNFRFMGLWDTVLSTNRSGYTYQLGIPSQFSYVAQAVALNEHRSGGLSAGGDALNLIGVWALRNPKAYSQHAGGFPLESIGASSNTPGKVRIELGFIGAHADIGGGYAESENGLSLVALSWMVKQASEAGVTMNAAPALPTGSSTILHDQSNAIRVGNPLDHPVVSTNMESGDTTTYQAEDRTVRGAVSGSSQRTMGFGNNSMTNADALNGGFITYAPRDPTLWGNAGGSANPKTLVNRTGTVDMDKYVAWLKGHGYAFAN